MKKKNKKKRILLPIVAACLILLIIGAYFLTPVICFYYYTNKAIKASTRKVTDKPYLSCTETSVRYSVVMPNQVIRGNTNLDDLYQYYRYSVVITDKLGASSFRCTQYKHDSWNKSIIKTYRMPEGKTFVRFLENMDPEHNEENPFVLELMLLRFKCRIIILADVKEYSEAERIAEYYGIDLPSENEITLNEYFAID